MNFPERAVIVEDASHGDAEHPVYAAVSLVSAKEGTDGAFLITDASIRIPVGYPLADNSSAIRVETGPLAGTYQIKQVRPSRHHTRYIASRLS